MGAPLEGKKKPKMKMGCGYGSEFHLLRYLGYHRAELNRQVEKETGGRVIEWLDFYFDPGKKYPHWDREPKGVDFLPKDDPARATWGEFWPQSGNVQNWDAVGQLQSGSENEYLLVEAKGHVGEIKSDCKAKDDGGPDLIRKAFDKTIKARSFASSVDKWLKGYYQYANRLATLHFLLKYGVSARLLFIYFLGDQWPEGKNSKGQPVNCPKTRDEWEPALKNMYDHLGLGRSNGLEERVHRLFLHVGGPR